MNDVPIRPAATILLLRDEPEFQVLMVRRHHQIDFASGALVFPGGKSHGDDDAPAWAEHALGWEGLDEVQRPLRIAAIREVFEEAGVLVGRRRDGGPIPEAACNLETRLAVDRGDQRFLDVVRDLDVEIDLGELAVFARWITPPLTPKRFDTWFYAVVAPPDQLAVCDGRETVDAEWIAPKEALRLAAAGERKIIFPTRMNLQLLAESASAAGTIAAAQARTLVTVEPKIEDRPEGRVLTLPVNAGYGEVAEPLSSVM